MYTQVNRTKVSHTPLTGYPPKQAEIREPVKSADRPARLSKALQVAIMNTLQAEGGDPYVIQAQNGYYEASNPKQALEASFFPAGVLIASQDANDDFWTWGLQMIGYGRGDQRVLLPEVEINARDNRVEYRRGNLIEWYVNGPLGIEQGFTLQNDPIKQSVHEPLVIELALQNGWDIQLAPDGQSLALNAENQKAALQYGHLFVQDSQDRFLPVHLEVVNADPSLPQHIRIVVDDRDAIYPITIDPLIQQQDKVTASDGAANVMFGDTVAIYGDTAVVGSYAADLPSKTDAGAAYVFIRTGTTWTQQQKLTASDSAAGDYFGNSVAIYGDTIVVGADQADLPSKINAGAAYVFIRTGTTWTQQQKLTASDSAASDFFGIRCAIYADTVVVTASSADLPSKTDAGAAYVFVRSAGVWSQQQKLTASDSAANAYFGSSTDVYLDTTIVGCGSIGVYVYVRSAGVWTQQQKLVASDGVATTAFGYSAKINGDTVIVGAPQADLPGKTDAGAAYVFVRSAGVWSQQQKLTASDAVAGDRFGYSVDVNANAAIIGAPNVDLPSKADAGAVYVFLRSGATWTQGDKITADDSAANELLGYYVAVSGSSVIAGAPSAPGFNKNGAAYHFSLVYPPVPPNGGPPSSGLSWAGEVHNGSIILRTGEKIESATDLSVQSTVGALDFTRNYRQNKRSTFQYMGMGWQHNHALTITKITGTPNKLVLQMGNGGELNLTETAPGSNQYRADAGSDAIVNYNAGTSKYTLITSEKSQYIFDLAGKLIERVWPPFSDDATRWIYTYDGSNRLTTIEEQLDASPLTLSGRKLIFAYINNVGQYNHGQLWRIGDQDTTTITGTPGGRYVEFSYTPQKNGGTTIGGAKALLNTVRDPLGNVWTYRYYGQAGGETDLNRLDFMMEVLSPSVDTTGDGVADGALSLEQLSYTVSGAVVTNITQNQGNSALNTAYAFQPSGQNVTTETIGGKTGTHTFTNGVYKGFTDPAGNSDAQSINFQYRPENVKDANEQETQMSWSPDGKFLQSVKDALGNVTVYSYNVGGAAADTLNYVQDPEGRKTQYVYGDATNPLLPTAIKFLDTNGTTVLRWQTLSYDSKGRLVSSKQMAPADGTTIMRQTDNTYYSAAGNGRGLLQSETVIDVFNSANNYSTTYTYDSKGRVIKTQKTSMFGCCEFTYTVYDAADRVVAFINSDTGQTPPADQAAAILMYDSANPDKNRVTTYYYDTLGRRVGTRIFDGASYSVTELTVYDALGRVIRTIANYVSGGGITNPFTVSRASFSHGTNSDQNLVTDNVYNSRGKLRKQTDPLDNVTLFGYDDADRLVKTIRNAVTTNYNNDYSGMSPDPSLASYGTPSSNPDQDIVTTQTYDKAGNLVKMVDPLGVVTYMVYDALNRPVKVVKAAKDAATIALNVGDVGYVAANDPRSASYLALKDPDRDRIESNEYDKMGRVIRTQAYHENRPTGEWETTLYGFDGLGRSVKVIKVASSAAYNIAADPTLASYSPSGSADQDLVTRTTYSPRETVLHIEDLFGSKTWFAYDGLDRTVKTIVNAVGNVADGTANDPRSGSYVPSAAADKDLIAVTTYDSDGRAQTVTDALGRVTHYVRDTVGCVLRTIQNYVSQGDDPATWVYSSGWKKSGGSPISHGTDNDENIVTRTVYDGKGRAVQSIDHRNNVTLMVYDTLDRPVKTIANYIPQGGSQPANWVWSTGNTRWEDGSGNAISFGTENDQNRITATTYDLLGHVLRVRDAAGIETRFTVDLLGRRTQTIANYANGLYSSATPDEDLISTTVFNKMGQILSTTDVRGTQTAFTYDKLYRPVTLTRAVSTPLSSVTYTCYDKAGRVQRVIKNWSNTGSPDARDANGNWTFVPATNGSSNDLDLTLDSRLDRASRTVKRIINYRAQGITNPSNWIWSTANNRWEDGGGVAISFGTKNDQNLINLMTYYKDGQVESTTDAEGVVTKLRYDLLRRQLRKVQAWVNQTEDPILWTWDPSQLRWETSTGVAIAHGTNSDQNIVEVLYYDKGGRLITHGHPSGGATAFTYDKRNRRKMLTNPITKSWSTVYTDLAGAGVRTSATYPGISGSTYTVHQDADRLGRPLSIQYGDPSVTPDVKMGYDAAGNRSKMSEYAGANFTSRNRETTFGYDKLHRITSAGFDNNGNGSVDETVSYQYDAGGLRTRLTLPGSLQVNYTYDARGRLISLTDWDSPPTGMTYDLADRHLSTTRDNDLDTRYEYDSAGRLRLLKHRILALVFGTNTVKDDFNRADSASLGANWGAYLGVANLGINANECRNPAADGTTSYAGNYYTVAQYGPDCEAYLTLRSRPTDLAYISVRVAGSLTTPTSYNFGLNTGGSGIHKISRSDSGVEVQLGATFSQALAIGDSIGIAAVGSTISAYYKPSGGSWTLLASRTDTTYTAAGYVALVSQKGGWKADNFGAGVVSLDATSGSTLGHFEYTVDKRGNRVQVLEVLANAATTDDTLIDATNKGLALTGTWTTVSSFKESIGTSAVLKLMFLSNLATLTMGKGPDHGRYDLYINGVFWQNVDGYAASATQADITVPTATLINEGPHILEVRNTVNKNPSSSGYKVRFKQLLVTDKEWSQQNIKYTYDKLERVLEARYCRGLNLTAVDADLQRRYLYTYDRMHNRLTESLAIDGNPPTVKTLTYNTANQISSAGYTYDHNGNLTSDGTTYIWDRANRLLSMGGSTYKYEGGGNRIQQIVGGNTSNYLLDLNSGLPTVVAETVGANVTRFVHSLRGLHQLKTSGGIWEHMLTDALGSLRVVTNNAVAVQESRNYGVYGDAFDLSGTNQTNFGYTGEPTDGNGLVYDRARYMSPALGQFVSLDPKETFNRYAYTDGNPVMRTDPSGLVSRLMVDRDDGYAVTPKSNGYSRTPATGSTTWQPPVWDVAPPVAAPPTTSNESAEVQKAYNNVVASVAQVTQNCSSITYRNSHADLCNIQNRLLGRDQYQMQYDAEWGTSLDPRFKPMKAVANGQINTRTLARNMSFVFGYNVVLGGLDSTTNKTYGFVGTAEQAKLLTLKTLDASLQITSYLQNTQGKEGLTTFQDVFGTTAGGKVTLYLGANYATKSANQGFVPLSPNLTNMYLGSQMSVPDIVHEFGHQLERHYGNVPVIPTGSFDSYMPNVPRTPKEKSQLDVLTGSDPTYIGYTAHPVERTDIGFASETFADYFMTAVLAGQPNYIGTNPSSPISEIGWRTDEGILARRAFNYYTWNLLTPTVGE